MKLYTPFFLSLLSAILHQHACIANQWSFTKASFISPANPPTAATTTTTISFATSSALFAAKKKSSSSAPPASKKIQVKLLKHVAGTGQAGEVVMVTPPFFNNKLRPTKSAELITDEQVQMQQARAALAEKERQNKAESLKEQLEGGEALKLTRKVGPDGQLFGGIGVKNIVDELKATTGADDFLGDKNVKITALMDDSGKKMRGDIKHTGSFKAVLSLTRDISATVEIEVTGEA